MTKVFSKGLIVLFIFSMLIVSSCSSTQTTQEATKKLAQITPIKVAYMSISDCMALYFADAKGYFTDENLKVEMKSYTGGSEIISAMNSGEFDLGFSNTVSVLQGFEKGSDMKFIAPGAFIAPETQNVMQIFVSKKSNIKSPKDLEGKTIAVNTPNNIMDLGLRAWADAEGVDYNKLKVVALPFPQMESAMVSGQIDAAFSPPPFPTLAVENGVADILDSAPMRRIGSNMLIASYIAKQSWIDTHQDVAQAYIRAINKANTYIQQHPEEIPVILPKYTRTTAEVAARVPSPTFKDTITPAEIQVWIDAAIKYGYITTPMKPNDVVMTGVLK